MVNGGPERAFIRGHGAQVVALATLAALAQVAALVVALVVDHRLGLADSNLLAIVISVNQSLYFMDDIGMIKNKQGVLVAHRVQSAGLEVVLERVQAMLYAVVAPAIGLLPRGPGAILGARAILDVPPKTILTIVIGRVDPDAFHREQ